MKNNNGWIKLVVTAITIPTIFIWANNIQSSVANVKQEHREDINLLNAKIDKIEERTADIDKKITKLNTLVGFIFKQYGISKTD